MSKKISSEDFIKAFEWHDVNGNAHTIKPNIELKFQQPNCKYLLPCGLCSITSDLKTCSLLMEAKKNEDIIK